MPITQTMSYMTMVSESTNHHPSNELVLKVFYTTGQ